MSFLALLSFEFLNNSMTRRSYGANPTTSRTIERTNLVRVDWTPFLCEGLTDFGISVVVWPLLMPRRVSSLVGAIRTISYTVWASTHRYGPFLSCCCRRLRYYLSIVVQKFSVLLYSLPHVTTSYIIKLHQIQYLYLNWFQKRNIKNNRSHY